MQIVTVQFNYTTGPDYKKLLDVFRYSCKKYTPKCEFIEYKIQAPKRHYRVPYNFTYNTVKLKIWRDHLRKTKDNIIFADCDMMAIRNFSHAFEKDFDICYTERTRTTRIPMNGGILFVRPNERSLDFFEQWYQINLRMHECDVNGNFALHNKYRNKWAGMNQASWGWMMEHKDKYTAKVVAVKTREWNAVDCDWAHIENNPATCFIHYKSGLRKAVLRQRGTRLEHVYAKRLWDNMYAEMTGRPVRVDKPQEIIKVEPSRLVLKRHKRKV